MKHFKVSINVDDGLTQRTYTTYVEAESEEEARKSIMSCYNWRYDVHAEILEVKEA